LKDPSKLLFWTLLIGLLALLIVAHGAFARDDGQGQAGRRHLPQDHAPHVGGFALGGAA
jgi:hypothetical protein